MQEFLRVVWTDNPALGRGLMLLVGLASAVATALALYHVWRYSFSETRALEQLRGYLKSWQREQRGPRQELVGLDRLKKATPRASLSHRRLLTIERMRLANVKVDFEALQQITFAAESSKLGLRAPAFAVSFVLLLGLFGSVASLCLTLPGLSVAGADGGPALGAMSASFSCGMAGLLGAVWASLVNLWLSTAQARFFEKFERFTAEELLPLTVPDIRSEAWLMEMHYKIGEAFDRIKQVAEHHHQSVREFGAVAEGFSRLVDGLEQSARKGASADVQRVLGQLGQVIGQVSRTNDSVLNLAASVPRALEAARTQNQQVLTRLDAFGQQAGERHENLAKQLAAANERLPQALQAVQQSSQAAARRIEEALGRGGGVAHGLAAQAPKLLTYSVPPMLLLILLILLAR